MVGIGPYNSSPGLTLFIPMLSSFSSRVSSRTGLNCFSKVGFRLRAASTFCCPSREASSSAAQSPRSAWAPAASTPKAPLHLPGPHSASDPGLQPVSPGPLTLPKCLSQGQKLGCLCSWVPLPQTPPPTFRILIACQSGPARSGLILSQNNGAFGLSTSLES